MTPQCLNLSDSVVNQYVSKYGIEHTYRIFIRHNNFLPDFTAYQNQQEHQILSKQAVADFLQGVIKDGLFDKAPIADIKHLLPQTAEAAFWHDIFYFGDQISRGALYEEVFHAIFQRLTTNTERQQLLESGKTILREQLPALGVDSIDAYYQQQLIKNPQTYASLSKADGYNRLYEEALAQEYVRYTTYGQGQFTKALVKPAIKQRLQKFVGSSAATIFEKLIHALFDGLDRMRQLFSSNQLYADLFFARINRGDFISREINNSSLYASPTTRIIYLDGGKRIMAVQEANQLIFNLAGLTLQLRNQPGLENLTTSERLDVAMKAFSDQYRAQPMNRGESIAALLMDIQLNEDTLEEEPNPDYNLLKADVARHLNSIESITDLQDENDEDEYGARLTEFNGYGKEANETGGYTSLSGWLKLYISMAGKVRLDINGNPIEHSISVQVPNEQLSENDAPVKTIEFKLPVVDIVNPDKVYYGLLRATSNSTYLQDRLERMLTYTEFEGSEATSAFVDQLLKDLAPTQYSSLPELKTVLDDYKVTGNYITPRQLSNAMLEKHPHLETEQAYQIALQAFQQRPAETDPSIIRQQIRQHIAQDTLADYLSPSAIQLLIRTMKGFDLWKRMMQVQLVDPSNELSQTINANQNRGSKYLMELWENSYRPGKKPMDIPGYNPKIKATASIGIPEIKEVEEKFEALSLEDRVAEFTKQLKEQSKAVRVEFELIGVTLSDAYIQYVLLSNALKRYKDDSIYTDALTQTPAYNLVQQFYVAPEYVDLRTALAQTKRFSAQTKFSPFGRGTAATSNSSGDMEGGMATTLSKIAEGNAVFDESALESNYLSADNKLIYAYQKKTFNLTMFNWFAEKGYHTLRQMHDSGHRTLLRYDEQGQPVYMDEDSWTLKDNWLLNEFLNNPFYQQYQHLFQAFAVDGVQQTSLERSGTRTKPQTGSTANVGQTYGDLSGREFNVFNINTLSKSSQLTTYLTDKNGNEVILAPVFLGNRETARMGEYMILPLRRDLYNPKTGKLTTLGEDLLLTEIEKEYNRIQKVSKQIDITADVQKDGSKKQPTAKATINRDNHTEFLKYNTGKLIQVPINEDGIVTSLWVPANTGDLRGLQFSDAIAGLMGKLGDLPVFTDQPLETNNLVIQALLDKPFNRDALRATLQQNIQGIVNAHINHFTEQGLWDKTTNKPTKLIDKDIQPDLIKHKIISDMVNNIGFYQIATGDQALLFKNDGYDRFKRDKLLNAAIVSFYVPFAAPELGIYQPSTHINSTIYAEPTLLSDVDGSPIDLADAQGHQTIIGRRISLYGQAKLDLAISNVLDAIQEGKPLTGKLLETYWENESYLGTEKTVGATGQHTRKLSVAMLSKELTSKPIPITKEEYEQHAKIDRYGRTELKTGATEVSSYLIKVKQADKQVVNQRVYFKWLPIAGRVALHEQRLLMEGFRHENAQTNQAGEITKPAGWYYKGYNYQLQLITPVSASKTLNVNIHKDYYKNQDGNYSSNRIDWRTYNEQSTSLIDLNFYGLQVEPGSPHTEITDPTQMLEIIAGELANGFSIDMGGKKLTKQDLEGLWEELRANRDLVNYNLADKIFTDSDGNFTSKRLREILFEQAQISGKDRQTIALLDPQTGYNPNLPLTRYDFISSFFSYYSKRVLSHKRAGDAMIHMSSNGFHGLKKIKRITDAVTGKSYITWDYISEQSDEYNQLWDFDNGKTLEEIYNTRNLSTYRYKHEYTYDVTQDGNISTEKSLSQPLYYEQDGKKTDSWFKVANDLLGDKDEVLVYDILRHAKPRWEKVSGTNNYIRTGYFSESLMPSHDYKHITNSIPGGLRYGFGTRIPAQDRHSALNTEWVDLLPIFMNSTIATVKEVVQLSGSDFDVDKLYLIRTEGYWQKNTFIPYAINKSDKINFQQYLHYILTSYKEVRKSLTLAVKADPELAQLAEELNKERDTQQDTTATEAEYRLNKNGDVVEAPTFSPALVLYQAYLADDKFLRQEYKERYQQLLENVFTQYGLPATLSAYKEQHTTDVNAENLNMGIVNNQLLNLQQQFLLNDITLDDDHPEGGQANQPATLKKLEELKEDEEELEDGTKVKLFGDRNRKISNHFWLTHSRVHIRNQIGKVLIGVGVNANLFIIRAIKAGFKVSEFNMPLFEDGLYHDGFYKTQLTYKNGDPVLDKNGNRVRIGDIISTLITAATDEAKEGLNAFFQLNADALGVAYHLIGLGYQLGDVITLINLPMVKQYFSEVAIYKQVHNNKGIITAAEEAYRKSSPKKIAMKLMQLEVTDEFEPGAYTVKQLRQILAISKSNKSFPERIDGATPLDIQRAVLLDIMKMEKVVTMAGNYIQLIKLSKGFGQELFDFDKLERAVQKLQVKNPPIDIMKRMFGIANKPESGEKTLSATLSDLIENDEEDIAEELTEVNTEDLKPIPQEKRIAQLMDLIYRNSQRQTNLFLRRSPIFNYAFNCLNEVFYAQGEKPIELLSQAVETRILTTLFMRLFDPGKVFGRFNPPSLNLVYNDAKSATMVSKLNLFRQQYGQLKMDPDGNILEKGIFADSPLFSLLLPQSQKDVSMLTLNNIIKLRPDQQQTLMDAFQELITKENQPRVNNVPVGMTLAIELFTYFVAKDGFQFTMGNISKMFTPEIFRKLSESMDEFQIDKDFTLGIDRHTLAVNLITDLARDQNYTSLLNTMYFPGVKNKFYAKTKKIITHQTVNGTLVKSTQPGSQFTLNFESVINDENFRMMAQAFNLQAVTPENSDPFVVFPRFFKYTRMPDMNDPTGVVQEEVYELISAIDYDKNSAIQYTIDDLEKETVFEGLQARYAAVPLSGSKKVNPATGLGAYYAPHVMKKLQNYISQSSNETFEAYIKRSNPANFDAYVKATSTKTAIGNYYRKLYNERWKPPVENTLVAPTEQDDFDFGQSDESVDITNQLIFNDTANDYFNDQDSVDGDGFFGQTPGERPDDPTSTDSDITYTSNYGKIDNRPTIQLKTTVVSSGAVGVQNDINNDVFVQTDQSVEKRLKMFFKEFGFRYKEGDGSTDLLNKIIYVNKNDDSVFIDNSVKALSQLMLANSNIDFSKLEFLIEDTPEFKSLLKNSSDYVQKTYKFLKDGNRIPMQEWVMYIKDYNHIKNTVLEKYLKESLLDKNNSTKLHKLINDFIAWFKDLFANAENIKQVTDALVQQVLLNQREVIINNKDLLNKEKVSLQNALQETTHGKDIIKTFGELGLILTGSVSAAEQGSVFRKTGKLLHDIDWVVPKGFDKDFVQKLKDTFPGAALVREFDSGTYYTQTFMVPPKGYTISNMTFFKPDIYGKNKYIASYDVLDKLGNVISNYRRYYIVKESGKVIEDKEVYNEGLQNVDKNLEAVSVDFFSNKEKMKYEPYIVYVDGMPLKLASWLSSFTEKLKYGRAKDLLDYANFVPNDLLTAPNDSVTETVDVNTPQTDEDFKMDKACI